jgi:hypothetical protein
MRVIGADVPIIWITRLSLRALKENGFDLLGKDGIAASELARPGIQEIRMLLDACAGMTSEAL